jgi:2-polyprenyl-3-methyl-5-hydroxy-6-metoxy-1,4-benzoquinol methylase
MSEYDNIADIYSTLISTSFKKINNIIDTECERHMRDLKKKVVLDVPCGDGKYSQLMLENGANDVVGIDISEEMIRKCKNRILPKDASFFCGDIANFDLSKIRDLNGDIKKYDVIYTFALWHYLPDLNSLENAVNNLSSHLKRNGVIYALILDSINIPCESQILNVWHNGDQGKKIKDGDEISWNYLLDGDWMFPKNIKSYFWENDTLKKIFKQYGLEEVYRYNLLSNSYKIDLNIDEKVTLKVWNMWKFINNSKNCTI